MTTMRSRWAADAASRALASEPPTRASGEMACTELRNASTVSNASSDAGSACSTTDHWLSPASDSPAGRAETTPGTAVMADETAAASAVGAMTTAGSVNPLGKCSASVL